MYGFDCHLLAYDRAPNPAYEAIAVEYVSWAGLLAAYEQEADLFFEDLSNKVAQGDLFQRSLTFPNVIITGHQAFFTETAL